MRVDSMYIIKNRPAIKSGPVTINCLPIASTTAAVAADPTPAGSTTEHFVASFYDKQNHTLIIDS